MVSSAATRLSLLRFSLLGTVQAFADGVDVPLGGPRQAAVLGRLLLVPNQVVTMDQLVDAIWDGDEPARPEVAIRSYVSNLRRLIEPHRPARTSDSCLVSVPPGYRLDIDRQKVDAVAFEDLVKRGEQRLADGMLSEASADLGDALEMWRGEPLTGLPESEVFTAHRHRLLELRSVGREIWFEAQLGLGQHRVVSAAIEEAVLDAPYRERLTELGMVALYQSGRQSDALALGQSLRQRLRNELGINPGPGIDDTEHRILNHDPSLAPPADVIELHPHRRRERASPPQALAPTDIGPLMADRDDGPGPDPDDLDPDDLDMTAALIAASLASNRSGQPPRRRPVGRTDAMGTLDRVARRHCEGRGTLTLLTGEYGMGKSELARDFMETLAEQGTVWGWSQAVGSDRAADLGTGRVLRSWAFALSDLFLHLPREVIATVTGRSDLSCLTWLGPTVTGTLLLEPDAETTFDVANIMLAVVRLLSDLSHHRPLALMLDDLHRSDEHSIALIDLASTSLARFPVAIVGAWRPGQAADPVTDLALADLSRQSTASRIDLAPMSQADVAALANHLGVEIDAGSVAKVHRRSAGNPLFATEILRLPVEARRLATETAAPHPTMEAHAALVHSVEAFAGRLGEEASALLTLGALYRLPFTAHDLAFVYPADAESIERSLASARRAGILVETSLETDRLELGDGARGSGEGYAFRHPIVAEVLAGQLAMGDRARRHRDIGRMLADRGAHGVEIAYHLSLSPEPEDHVLALTVGLQAFRSDPAGTRHVDLDKVVQRGLATADHDPDLSTLRCEAQLYLAWRSRLMGSPGSWRRWAETALGSAIALARRGGPAGAEAEVLLLDAVLTASGASPFPVGPGLINIDSADAAALVDSVAEAIDLIGDRPAARSARVHLLGLRTLVEAGDSVDPSSAWTKGAREARRLTTGHRRQAGGTTVAPGLAALNWFGDWLEPSHRLELLDSIGRDPGLDDAVAIEEHRYRAALDQGEAGGGAVRLAPLLRMADSAGDPFTRIAARTLMVRHLLLVGDAVLARRRLAELIRLSDRLGLSLSDPVIEQLFELRRQEGRAHRFVMHPQYLERSGLAPAARAARAAIMYAAAGQPEAAGRWLEQAIGSYEWCHGASWCRDGSLAWMAESAASVGGVIGRRAAELVNRALGPDRTRILFSPSRHVVLGSAAHYCALSAAVLGDHEEAVASGRLSAEVACGLGSAPLEHRSLAVVINSLRALGRDVEAAAVRHDGERLSNALAETRCVRIEHVDPTVTTDLWLSSSGSGG